MSDVNITIKLPSLKVAKTEVGYAVAKVQTNGSIEYVSGSYAHSTSAYAKLGRIVHAVTVAAEKAGIKPTEA